MKPRGDDTSTSAWRDWISWSIDANTSLDVLDLSERRTQVALREGSGLFDVGSISSGNLFEVATPCGAVDVEQPGLYQIAINENGNAVATVFNGEAQIVGQGGASRIQKGEYLAVQCQGSAPAVMSRVEPSQAGCDGMPPPSEPERSSLSG